MDPSDGIKCWGVSRGKVSVFREENEEGLVKGKESGAKKRWRRLSLSHWGNRKYSITIHIICSVQFLNHFHSHHLIRSISQCQNPYCLTFSEALHNAHGLKGYRWWMSYRHRLLGPCINHLFRDIIKISFSLFFFCFYIFLLLPLFCWFCWFVDVGCSLFNAYIFCCMLRFFLTISSANKIREYTNTPSTN